MWIPSDWKIAVYDFYFSLIAVFLFVVDYYFYTKSFLDSITGNEPDFDYLFLKHVCLAFLGLRASALSPKCCSHWHAFFLSNRSPRQAAC